MNGWYVVYIMTCFLNAMTLMLNGFNITTWQFWAWTFLVILSYIAGKNS